MSLQLLLLCAVLCLVTQSCLTLCDPIDCSPPGSSVHGDSPGKNTGVGSRSLLQGIFPTQGWNPGLPHCRRILYCLSYQGSSRTLEWVAYPFSRGSSWPRNWTRVSCIAGGFFTSWATREAPATIYLTLNMPQFNHVEGGRGGLWIWKLKMENFIILKLCEFLRSTGRKRGIYGLNFGVD